MRNVNVYITFTLLSLLLLQPLFAQYFNPDHPTQRRILVLLDDVSLKSSHSIFFNSLQSRGFDLDIKLAEDPTIKFKRYGEYLYDGLVIFATNAERFGSGLDCSAVLDFVDFGHDMIAAAER